MHKRPEDGEITVSQLPRDTRFFPPIVSGDLTRVAQGKRSFDVSTIITGHGFETVVFNNCVPGESTPNSLITSRHVDALATHDFVTRVVAMALASQG